LNPKIISPSDLALWLADAGRPLPLLLDVREPAEVQVCQIPGSIPIPMHSIPARIAELDPEMTIVCICHHGARSMQVVRFLDQNGFDNVINLTGGIHAWATQVDLTMPVY